jgi:hypothetical protein
MARNSLSAPRINSRLKASNKKQCFLHAVIVILSVPVIAASGQITGQVPAIERPPEAKPGATFDPHDLSGKWNRISPFETFSNVPGGAPGTQGLPGNGGKPVAEAQFTPEGKKRFDANKPSYGRRQVAPMQGNDPQMTCDPMGVPRVLNAQVKGPHATMEIAMTPDRMLQFFQWHHDWREIWLDGRSLPKLDEAEPKWDGYSVGRWDGETFVVDSIGFDERTWLDHNGYPHSDQMHLEERYRRLDANTLELIMTVTDPVIYSKPFVSDTKIFKLDRVAVKDWDPQIYCVPSEEFRFNSLIRDGGAGKQK